MDPKEESPPYTWGIPWPMNCKNRALRITPTYMGNTCCYPSWLRPDGDHPHIHGEYRRHHRYTAIGIGITPTYMGNTNAHLTCRGLLRDHPHIHGEYSVMPANKYTMAGSPPHTWGIRQFFINPGPWTGITPTYMGNTLVRQRIRRRSEDHPHIHGEYTKSAAPFTLPIGSPPHTWGILAEDRSKVLDARITPTYMGNTTNVF